MHDRNMQTCALYDQSIKFLSPSESQMQLWNVMSHLSGGRLPALPALAMQWWASQHHLNHPNATRICFAPLHKVSCGTSQAVTARFANTSWSERLTLASWAGSVARAGPQECWDCPGALLLGQDKDVYTGCIDTSRTQSWSIVGVLKYRSSTSLS